MFYKKIAASLLFAMASCGVIAQITYDLTTLVDTNNVNVYITEVIYNV